MQGGRGALPTVYLWREQDPEFARAMMEEAKEWPSRAWRRRRSGERRMPTTLRSSAHVHAELPAPRKYRGEPAGGICRPGGARVQIEARAVDQRFMLSPEAMRAMEAAGAMLKRRRRRTWSVSNGD